eukprot:COSAG01_NODE_40809_length_459_cov_1.294444_1_plen_89_part_10
MMSSLLPLLLLLLLPSLPPLYSGVAVVVASTTTLLPAAAPGRCGSAPCSACGIPRGNTTCAGHHNAQYSFHISDTTCGSNDPNGVFYDR